MLIVVTLIALVSGLSYPSIASGLGTLRLRSTSDAIVSLLNTAIERADRRQQVVEIWISTRDNVMIARSADSGFVRRLDVQDPIHITEILPAIQAPPDEPRRFLLYPGGAVPRIAVAISNKEGRRRLVSVDPITGTPEAH